MDEMTMGINWLAVGIATVLSFSLGALWFSPMMFGEKWAEGVGAPSAKDARPPMGALLLQFVGTFLFAWLIGIAAASGAMPLAFLIAVMLSVLLTASDLLGGSSRYAALAEGSFPLAMFGIVLLCLAVL